MVISRSFGLVVCFLFLISFASSLTIQSVEQGILYPGQETDLSINIENGLDYDAEEVSLSIIFTDQTGKSLGFSPIGSSEDTFDEIREDKNKEMVFRIKASNSIEPGDYNLPYILIYKNENDTKITKSGYIGISVNSKTRLDYIIGPEKPVIGMKDKLTLSIINRGLGEIKSVSIQIVPEGYSLLSEDKVFVGSISSDDFQSASFDVIYTKTNPNFVATIEYLDFENNEKIEQIRIPFEVYTKEQAIQKQIISKNNSLLIIIVVLILLIAFLIYRKIRRSRKIKPSN